MIIDAHIHVGAWDLPEFLGRENTLEDTLQTLQDCGIDGALLTPSDRLENEKLLQEMQAVSLDRFPGPLWFFPWLTPCTGDGSGEKRLEWVQQVRHAVAGIKLHPSLSRQRVSEAGFRPVLELAQAEGLAVLVHCGRWQEIASFRFALDAAEAYPGVRFVLAHAGGDTPGLAMGAARGAFDRGLTNVYFDFAGLREYWVLERTMAFLGWERYLMASDYPLAHPRMYLGQVQGMALTPEAREGIMGGNALKILGKPVRRPTHGT